MSTPVILYILECRHIAPGRIGVMDLECINCPNGPVRHVVDVHTYEWRMYCETCNYKPWCGLSRETAKYHANMHVRKRPEHRAKVLYMENPFSVKIRDRLMEGMPNVERASSQRGSA